MEDGAEQITPDGARDLSRGQILARDPQLREAYKKLQDK
jgi:hypothetical protein